MEEMEVIYVDIYACVFLANYLSTTTVIFTGWLGLALILGLGLFIGRMGKDGMGKERKGKERE